MFNRLARLSTVSCKSHLQRWAHAHAWNQPTDSRRQLADDSECSGLVYVYRGVERRQAATLANTMTMPFLTMDAQLAVEARAVTAPHQGVPGQRGALSVKGK